MKQTHYVPVFDWGSDPDSVHGCAYGSLSYSDLQMLDAYEPDAVGYLEVQVEVLTENEFRTSHSLKSGAE